MKLHEQIVNLPLAANGRGGLASDSRALIRTLDS